MQRVANQTLAATPQPAAALEAPINLKMSPPTNEVANGLVVAAPGELDAPARLPSPAAGEKPPSQSLATPVPAPQKRSPKDFIFGKVIGEGSFSTVSPLSDSPSPAPPTAPIAPIGAAGRAN